MTVHAGKCFKSLINSVATKLIDMQSVYNMLEDHYKTRPTAIHLRRADGSLMSSMGKATLHLQIADFNFSHTFIISNTLPETDFLFGIGLQKWYSLSYCWDSDRHLFIQSEGSFLTYTRNREGLQNVTVVKSTLKIPPRHNSTLPIRIKDMV